MLRLLKIEGSSLEPEYQEGDYVVVSIVPFFFRSIRAGDVIVFQQLVFGIMIKRVEWLDSGQGCVFVTGTHPDSIDSRRFGPVRLRDVIGKVICHIRKK